MTVRRAFDWFDPQHDLEGKYTADCRLSITNFRCWEDELGDAEAMCVSLLAQEN